MKSLQRFRDNYEAGFLKNAGRRNVSLRNMSSHECTLSLGLRCLIHASARLTDSIPGESATTAAAALIESEGGEGAAAPKMKIKPQIAATLCKQPLKPPLKPRASG